MSFIPFAPTKEGGTLCDSCLYRISHNKSWEDHLQRIFRIPLCLTILSHSLWSQTPSPLTPLFPPLSHWLPCSSLPWSVSSQHSTHVPIKNETHSLHFSAQTSHRTSHLAQKKSRPFTLTYIWPLLFSDSVTSHSSLCFLHSSQTVAPIPQTLLPPGLHGALCPEALLVFIWRPDLLLFLSLLPPLGWFQWGLFKHVSKISTSTWLSQSSSSLYFSPCII